MLCTLPTTESVGATGEWMRKEELLLLLSLCTANGASIIVFTIMCTIYVDYFITIVEGKMNY